MSISCFIKLLAAAVAAALVAYGAATVMAISGAMLLATGILLGTLFGGLLVALYPNKDQNNAHLSSASDHDASDSSNIYIGNLPFNIGKEEIQNLLSPYGEVIEIRMVTDRRSKRFKGYAFVEMHAAAAVNAIAQLNDSDYAGRTLRVNEAKKREQ